MNSLKSFEEIRKQAVGITSAGNSYTGCQGVPCTQNAGCGKQRSKCIKSVKNLTKIKVRERFLVSAWPRIAKKANVHLVHNHQFKLAAVSEHRGVDTVGGKMI